MPKYYDTERLTLGQKDKSKLFNARQPYPIRKKTHSGIFLHPDKFKSIEKVSLVVTLSRHDRHMIWRGGAQRTF